MSPCLLALAILAFDHELPTEDAFIISALSYQHGRQRGVDPLIVASVWRVETTWILPPERSAKGACGAMQVLGGRYNNPTCEEMESDLSLAVDTGVSWLQYWRDHCGERWLDCYNAGWKGRELRSYGYKVRRVRARLNMLMVKEEACIDSFWFWLRCLYSLGALERLFL